MYKPKVIKSAIVIFITCLTFGLVCYNPLNNSVLAATYNIKAFPLSSTEIRLDWESSTNNSYDVWQTTNGRYWSIISSVNQPQGYSVYRNTYNYSFLVTEGIYAYRNYYFVVTTKDTVQQYPEGSDNTNSSNEVVAYPPNRMGHGYFSDNTNLCANCHSTHTAMAPKLLAFQTANDSCISCHDGTGSKYNVINGLVDGDYNGTVSLKAPSGPFGAILSKASNTYPMSIHNLDKSVNSAPGGNPSSDLIGQLGCISCHDTHFSRNYRSLRSLLPDNPQVFVRGYSETDFANKKENVLYISGFSEFCKGCHKDYMALQGSGSLPASGTHQTDGKYRHPVGISILEYSKGPLTTTLDLEGPPQNNNYISCVTCHFSHGSESESNDFGNYLLKRDYRGVCEDCHKK